MKNSFGWFLLFFLLCAVAADAQKLHGLVVDAENGSALYPVSVRNLNSGDVVFTDDLGNFSITVKDGDPVTFTYIGYNVVQKISTPSILTYPVRVELMRRAIELKEFTFHDLTPYQKDSAEMAALYTKALNVQRIKPSVGFTGSGVAVSGLIGSVAQKMSKSYKHNKAFKEQFLKDEQQKYIDTRYTPELVTSLTHLNDSDSVAYFMNSCPMDYAFARTATDLELKMWIRDSYKQYLDKRKNIAGRVIEPANH